MATASFTVHHGITGSRYGEPLTTKRKAELYAVRLSNSLRHSLDVKADGDLISFAASGTIYPATVTGV